MPADKPLLEVSGLTVRLGRRTVLEDVGLEAGKNDFLAVIGPNGGGKTTLLKAILGLVRPEKGAIRIFGLPPGKARSADPGRIGYLPQKTLCDDSFPASALDVVLMGLSGRLGFFRPPGRPEVEKARQCLSMTGVADLAAMPFGALSGGQRQRVLIARALVTGPRLLLLDEPTADIDPAAREKFYLLLEELRAGLSLSIILVSHDIVFLPRHCRTIACLNRRIFVHGPPEKVMSAENLRLTYGCEVDLVVHGKVPHRVICEHGEENGSGE